MPKLFFPPACRRARRRCCNHVATVVLKALFVMPLFCVLIWIDTHVVSLPVPFPRDRDELMREPQRFMAFVKAVCGSIANRRSAAARGPLSSSRGGVLRGVRAHDVLEHEPDKNRDTILVDLDVEHRDAGKDDDDGSTATTNTVVTTVRLFVKFSCGRNFPLLLQGFRGACEWGLQRELDFYKGIAPSGILPCPSSVALAGNFAINRLCLVLDYVDGTVTPDFRGASLEQAMAVLTTAASMHGAFWGMNVPNTGADTHIGARAVVAVGKSARALKGVSSSSSNEELADAIVTCLDKLNARVGLEYFSFVRPMLDKPSEPKEFLQLWDAVDRWIASNRVTTTLVHGDCRLGNMIFVGDESTVLFSDFEAINVAPFLWDFVYFTVLCQSPADRRQRHETLLSAYLSALDTHAAHASKLRGDAAAVVKREGDPEILFDILALVLFFYAYTVERSGAWVDNGNTDEDHRHWKQRVDAVVQELDITKVSGVLGCDRSLLERVQALELGGTVENSRLKKDK